MASTTIKPPMWASGRNPTAWDLWRGCLYCVPMWEGAGQYVQDLARHRPITWENIDGGDWQVKKPGWSLYFDGAAHRLVTSGSLYDWGIRRHATLFAYASITTSNNESDLISDYASSNGLSLRFRDDEVEMYVYPNNHRITTTTLGLTDGAWHTVCGILDDANINLYVNGLAVGTDTFGEDIGDGADVHIGARGDEARHCEANIAMIAVWNRSLSAREILALAADPFCMIRQPDFAPFWDVAGAAAPTFIPYVLVG